MSQPGIHLIFISNMHIYWCETFNVRLYNLLNSWTKDRITLDDITLNVSGDKLLMVVGAVGSGKSSFLHSLIAELSVSRGQITVSGTTSYASQEPWVKMRIKNVLKNI